MPITNDSSSVTAGIENYRSVEDNGEVRILDDRPQKERLIAPLSLLYQPFGYFHDVRCGVKVPGWEGIDDSKLKWKVDALADAMTLFYQSGEVRRAECIWHLERIFDLSFGSINSGKISGGQKISDGHLNGAHGAMVLCVECKNEVSSASCGPAPRLASYIAASFAGQAKDGDHKDLFQRWRIPALGVTFVGATIQFFGVVYAGPTRIVPLTSALLTTNLFGDPEFRWDLFRAFKAAVLVFSKIRSDIGDFLQVLEGPPASWPPALTTETYRFPAVTEINAFPNPRPEKIKFVLNARHDDLVEDCQVYQATIVSPIQQNNAIYVKFSQRYSVDLHHYCASRGLAPKVLGFERLDGGWFVIAMERIDTVDREEIVSPSNAEKWGKDMKELVNGFHRKGLVHGNLRRANFVFARDPQRMLLVGFDWGGKEGEVTFPAKIIIKELEVSNNEFLGRKITKEHDQKCISKVLQWVREAGENAKGSEQEMKR